MELPVMLNLPDALLTELDAASRERGCNSPAAFVVELVHSELAARRLPFVAVGRCGARVHGSTRACDEPEEEPIDEDNGDEYVEPPLVDDLESLEGIHE
jgi:hypothetical protein